METSNDGPPPSLDGMPTEIILEIFDKINMPEHVRPIAGVSKKFFFLARGVANQQAHKLMQAGWETQNNGEDVILKDLDLETVGVCKRNGLSGLGQLVRIKRREGDWETLCHLVENALRTGTCNDAMVYAALGSSCYYFSDLFERFGQSVEGVLGAYHTLENIHCRQFASIRQILSAVVRWSEIELLDFALMSQVFGQFLYLVQGAEYLSAPNDHTKVRFEYMQALKLMLLLWGPRPAMLAILSAVNAHPNHDLRRALLEGTQDLVNNLQEDIRQPRSMEQGMMDPSWKWTTNPVDNNTFNRVLWYVRWSNEVLDGFVQTPAQPALFTGHLPIGNAADQISRRIIMEFGRPDLLVDGRMAHMMDNSEWTWLEDPCHIQNLIDERL